MDMKNIFAGLESFGLKGTNKVDVFQEKTDDKSQGNPRRPRSFLTGKRMEHLKRLMIL